MRRVRIEFRNYFEFLLGHDYFLYLYILFVFKTVSDLLLRINNNNTVARLPTNTIIN